MWRSSGRTEEATGSVCRSDSDNFERGGKFASRSNGANIFIIIISIEEEKRRVQLFRTRDNK